MNLLKKLFRKEKVVDQEDLGNLGDDARNMIKGVVELSNTSVKDVIVPRIDVVFIPEDITLEEIIKTVEESGHSRFPVYKESMDDITGILYVKDLMIHIYKNSDSSNFNLSDVIRKPYFVPESKKLNSLLKEFKRLHVHIAVAVDEYGGVSGIVSLEDIIEEVLGDIQDEFDNEDEDIVKIDNNTWLCDARSDIEDINKELDLNIEVDEIETIGGYVFNLIGEIPVKFEKIETEELTIVITEVDGNKIKRVKLVKKNS